MKKSLLALLLCLVASHGWSAIASDTTGLYDLEQNLSDTAGTAHGTQLRTMVYQTTGAWHSTYCGGGNGQFSIPAATLPSNSGTIEFSYRTAASTPNSSNEIVIGTTAGGSRTLEITNFGGSFYLYSGPFGWNTSFQSLSANTNYYFKITYDSGNVKIYTGAWTTAGTVTLTQVHSATGTYTQLAAVNSITFMRNPVDPNNGSYFNPGFIDWIRTRSVYDPTTTVTIDPASSGATSPLSPYINRSNTNWVTPKLYLYWLDKVFSRPLVALESNCLEQSRYNSAKIWEAYVKRLTPTSTPNPRHAKTATLTPTPVLTPTKTPSR